MIRYPASRILPGPEDINYHLNRVLMRQAARHQAYSPDDEPPIDDTDDDGSVYSSPSLEPGSGSGYESAGSSWPESQQDPDQDQQSEGGRSGSSVIHREPKHIHASRYLPQYQQSRRFTPDALNPQTHLHSLPVASASASTADSQVASLRILFETLSLNSLSSYSYPGIHRRLSPGLVPVKSTSQADTNTDPRMDNPQSDMTMDDAPSTSTIATRDTREPAVVNRGESTSEPTRRPRKIQKPNGPTGQTTRATLPSTSGQTQGTRPASTNTTTETLTSALTPDQWTHMMDASRAFHSHVQQMLAELDDEYDSEDEFGMRELRRRPAASAATAASGRGSTSPN